MQGIQGFGSDDLTWVQRWLGRVSSEWESLSFLNVPGLSDVAQFLTHLAHHAPDRYRELMVEELPRLLSLCLASDVDSDTLHTHLDGLSVRFPELTGVSRGHWVWLCRQIGALDQLRQPLVALLDENRFNVHEGFQNWCRDIESGAILPDTLRPDTFQLGTNLAITPGDVVFENQLFQLIQYRPTTAPVHAHPVLLIPAFVNRFYILDLTPEQSMVRWLVSQGHTVFLISWVNPGPLLANYSMTEYLLDGALCALDQIQRMLSVPRVQLMGYCAGGVVATLLASWLGRRREHRLASLTLLTTLVDYRNPGPLGDLVTAEAIEGLREPLHARGYLPAELMLRAFASLRPYDLVFNRMLQSYVRGERAKPFALMHWLGDGTRTPSALVLWMLESLYLGNRLVIPDALRIAGQAIDVGNIDVPTFIMAAEKDDISPWQSVMATVPMLKVPVVCVLGQGGHNAGVIHAPDARRKGHWQLDPECPTDLDRAAFVTGSWWFTWGRFLAEQGGSQIDPPEPGGGLRPVIEPAPGRFVLVR